MKTKILQACKFIQENQSGLFKIAILLILLYWTHLLKTLSYIESDLSSIETELRYISK
jgi:hypothetical protein